MYNLYDDSTITSTYVNFCITDWHLNVQIIFCMGMVFALHAFVILTVFQCFSKFRDKKALLIAFIFIQLGAGMLLCFGIIKVGQYHCIMMSIWYIPAIPNVKL